VLLCGSITFLRLKSKLDIGDAFLRNRAVFLVLFNADELPTEHFCWGRELTIARWGMPSPVFALKGKKSVSGRLNLERRRGAAANCRSGRAWR
jgi:hypothetical protein